MATLTIDVSDFGAASHSDDFVTLWSPIFRRVGTTSKLVSTAPRRVYLTAGKASVDVEPGPLAVEMHCRNVADSAVREFNVPDGGGSLAELVEAYTEYEAPVVSRVHADLLAAIEAAQEAAQSASSAAGSASAADQSAQDAAQSAQDAAAGVPDATASVRGKVRLAGDLGGSADAPTVPGLASKADLVGGLVPTSQLPAVALTKPQVVSNRAGMLALTAQEGDVAVITAGVDKGTYMLGPGSPTVFKSWVPLATPTDVVTSVNGQTGVVNLSASNVGAAPSSHTHSYLDISARTVYPDGTAPNSVVLTGTTGWFGLMNDPTDATHPARKAYVDTSIINAPKLHTWDGSGSWVAPANAGPNDLVLNTATEEIFSVQVV